MLVAILSFQHKGLEQFFLTGSKAGTQAAHSNKLRRLLAGLNVAGGPQDMNVPGWGFHSLQGRQAHRYAVLVDYLDYH